MLKLNDRDFVDRAVGVAPPYMSVLASYLNDSTTWIFVHVYRSTAAGCDHWDDLKPYFITTFH